MDSYGSRYRLKRSLSSKSCVPDYSDKWQEQDTLPNSKSLCSDDSSSRDNAQCRSSDQGDRDWMKRSDRNHKVERTRWDNCDESKNDLKRPSRHKEEKSRHSSRDRHRGSSEENDKSKRGGEERERCKEESSSSSAAGDGRVFNPDTESYRNQAPNSTIMIRGLAQHITENDVRQDILQCNLTPKDIRLIRKKDTGTSRGFAFVEFNTVEEAAQWMDLKQGVLMLQEQYRAVMHFSIPKEASYGDKQALKCSQDWYCVKCGVHNFKRRDTCFKCQSSRLDPDVGGEGSDEVTHYPTSTILLRGLDALTTEDTVVQCIAPHASSAGVAAVGVRIGLDPLTNTSRGLCYVQMGSAADATALCVAMIADPPHIDGRKALVSYYQAPSVLRAWARPESALLCAPELSLYTLADVPRLADYSATLYATTPLEHAAYVQYYRHYYQNQLAQGGTITLATQTDSVNAAAALAQSAIQQALAAKECKRSIMESCLTKPIESFKTTHITPVYYPQITNCVGITSIPFVTVPAAGACYPKYPVPDVSTYQYDETSGYYYDAHTGLYYDANTQHYYNSQTQQFLYWEADLETYTPAPDPPQAAPPAAGADATDDAAQAAAAAAASPIKDDGREERERPNDKVKVAKKIAKDMERWAKTLNQKKDNFRPMSAATWSATPPHPKALGAADAGYAVLERKERGAGGAEGGPEDRQPAAAADASGLVAAYGGGSDSDEEIEDVLQEERQHINWNALACLLCKRQFVNKETLLRHQQLSDLHKQNLSSWYSVRGLDPDDPQQRNNKYRDRAKERRLKFGEPNAPQPNTLKEKYLKAREDAVTVTYEEPTKAGIGNDNLGNKMLQKMGWQEGMGLGKSNQGRTSIIQTKQRVTSAGLGAKGGTYGALPGETYKDCVKKMMFARYQELTEQESS